MVHRREASDGDQPLREELAQLRADIDSLIGTVGRLADTAGDHLMSGAKRTMSDAQSRAGEVFDSAMAGGRKTLRSTEQTIQAHPYLSIAIAAGIGMLLGRLFASRD